MFTYWGHVPNAISPVLTSTHFFPAVEARIRELYRDGRNALEIQSLLEIDGINIRCI